MSHLDLFSHVSLACQPRWRHFGPSVFEANSFSGDEGTTRTKESGNAERLYRFEQLYHLESVYT